MSDARYTLANGSTAFTSEFLLKRGTCCKSGCLHCPFGFTINNFGLVFHQNNDQDFIDQVLKDNGQGTDYTSMLLQQNLGTKKSFDASKFSDDEIYTITLKDVPCGILFYKDEKIEKYFLEQHFMNQHITDIKIAEDFKNRH